MDGYYTYQFDSRGEKVNEEYHEIDRDNPHVRILNVVVHHDGAASNISRSSAQGRESGQS